MPIVTGTIYRIICLPEPNIQYIGSTFTTLKQRWSKHKEQYFLFCNNTHTRNYSIYPYFDEYGIENFKLIKIKEYQVWREHQKDTKHLRVYEQLWISKTKNINKNNTFFIRRYYNSNYNIVNKERIKEQKKEYLSQPEVKEHRSKWGKEYRSRPEVKEYNSNPKIKERNREYDKKNRNTEKRKEWFKKYKQTPEFKEKQKEKSKRLCEKRKLIKITCSCGSEFRKSDIRRHERSQKHIKYLESLN